MEELPREKLTKSTKILESIKTILVASKRRLCALHVPEEFSHIYLYCTTFYNRVLLKGLSRVCTMNDSRVVVLGIRAVKAVQGRVLGLA